MSGRRSVEDWRRAVFASAILKDSARVVLLYMADHMKSNLQVSIPRKTLAARLGRSERRISQRITEAHEAGFLDTVMRGHKGTTAVYVGTFPDAHSGTVSSPLWDGESVENRPPLDRYSGTPGGPTSSKHNHSSNVRADVNWAPDEKRSKEQSA